MAWVGFPAQSQISLFLEYPFPRENQLSCPQKNMAEALTSDMAFSDWLKLAALCLFRAQSVSKNKFTCDCAGQGRKVIDQHFYLIHSCSSV